MLLVSDNRLTKEDLALQVIEKVNLLRNYEDATKLIAEKVLGAKPVVLSYINAHAYNLCCTDVGFSSALLQSDIILRDGIGMEILYKAIGRSPGANLNGTDLIPELIEFYRFKKIALLGTEFKFLQAASQKLSSQGYNIVLTETGFHPAEHYVTIVNEARPDIIILGMGMPKQEKVSIFLKKNLNYPCLIVNGGAIIDFWGNKIHRAPMWLRRVKLEWLFRLAQEPTRLFSRYVVGNYVFLMRTKTLKKYLNIQKQGYRIDYIPAENVEKKVV